MLRTNIKRKIMKRITTDFYRCRPIRPFKLLYFITPQFSIFKKNSLHINWFIHYKAYYIRWFKWELEIRIDEKQYEN